MDYQINERWIKVSGKIPVPFNIEEGQDITCRISLGDNSEVYFLNAVKEEFPFNQDGTRDKVSVLQSLRQ